MSRRVGTSQMNGNNRRPSHSNRVSNVPADRQVYTQHEDLIRYVFDSWNEISQEMDRSGSRAVYYQEQENDNLKNFQPFNLEGYWGRRVVQHVEPHS